MMLFLTLAWSESYYYHHGKKVGLVKLKESRIIAGKKVDYYQNNAGQKIGVKKEILVKCNSTDQCKKIFKKYNLNNTINLTDSIILIKIEERDDPFELSQKLYREESIAFAHPNFIKQRQKR